MHNRYLLLVLCGLFTSISLNAQGFLRAQGKQIVNGNGENYVLKGMGLGGYMVQEGYMMQSTEFAPTQHELREKITEVIGEAATEAWYQAWRDNYLREADVEKMREMGFNSIRLPMHFNLYTLPIQAEPVAGEQTFLAEGFERTDSIVAWCKARDMYVILDLHAAPGGQGDDVAISDRDLDLPSLWDSPANQDKMVALWRRLAEHYADEPTIGGYDLLNETNYELPGNVAMRELYGRITDTIRAVDQNHLIIIEGNGFANDYTGLTPPWDENMAYSPHKYWSFNDQATIQYMLDLRDEQDTPLYLGETGENSNHWFRNAAKLYEDFNIGWAWWPWKKIESVVGPVSTPSVAGYRDFLEWGKGNAEKPDSAATVAALMQLAENLKLENSRFQQDVGDALFRQKTSDATIPYLDTQAIPGVLHTVDYDMGRVGFAYDDTELATYWVSVGGGFTSWNNGFAYRNDGVDIEATQDTELTKGYNVGWTADNEWMQYTVKVAEDGLYRVRVRTASGNDGSGAISLRIGEASLTGPIEVPNTTGWQTWRDVTIENVPLAQTDDKLRIYIDRGGFNLGGLEFTKTGELSEAAFTPLDAVTRNADQIDLTLSKPLNVADTPVAADFTVEINGAAVNVQSVAFAGANNRNLTLVTDAEFAAGQDIRVSYNGTSVNANDGSALEAIDRLAVRNLALAVYSVPGTLQAEDFYAMSGVELEDSQDDGGGQNIGFLDVGDYLDYNIDVAAEGSYFLSFRTASESFTGGATVQILNQDSSKTDLATFSFEPTGGWQTWVTSDSQLVDLPEGRQQLRLLITAPSFNVNYLEFASRPVSTKEVGNQLPISVSPNPSSGLVVVKGELPTASAVQLSVSSLDGRELLRATTAAGRLVDHRLDLSAFPEGVYIVRGATPVGDYFTSRVIRW